MRKRLTTVLLVGAAAIAPVALAAPDPKPSARPRGDDVHVTVTAGRGRLGLAVVEISPELRAQLGAPKDRGVLINTVRPDSSAARAGIRVGDVVVEVDGDPVKSAADMLHAMSDHKKGGRVQIAALRAGQRVELTAVLDDNPGPRLPIDRNFAPDFDDPLERFDWQSPRFRDDVQRELDEARRRLDELERRLERIERT